MAFPTSDHDPDARLDYPWNWGPWLAFTGDEVDEFTVDSTASEVVIDAVTVQGAIVIPWVRIVDGVLNVKYPLRYHIKTLGGREEDRTRLLKLKEK